MANQPGAPVAGGMPKSVKKIHGRSWLRKRERHGKGWMERKARSRRYCPATKTRG